MTDFVIRMDRSRAYSEIHGDRQPGDPHYHVHFVQDGLPFDAAGILVPDDGKDAPWVHVVELEDGKSTTIKHQPLYNQKMRDLVQTKRLRFEKMKGGVIEQAESQSQPVVQKHQSDEVNFEAWIRGEEEYETFILFPAWAKRMGRKHTKIKDLVEDIVVEEKLVPEEEVAPHLAGYIS